MKMQIQEKDKEEKKDDVIVKQKDSDKIEALYPKSPQKRVQIRTIDPILLKFLRNSPSIGEDNAGKLFLLDIIEN